MIDLQKAVEAAKNAAVLGRNVLLDYFGQLTKVSEKFQAGLVSEADVESERVISEYLRKVFPDIPILGEEGSYKNQGEGLDLGSAQQTLWLIDPLDGTTNYVHKFPIYCVSIGLRYAGELAVAVCDVPAFKTVYSAVKGRGAFRDDQKISVSNRQQLSDTLLATGFSNLDKSKHQYEVFSSLVQDVRGIRRAGSAAFDLCLVAEGVFDGYWEKGLSPWDTAAGALLVQEAGGVVSQYSSMNFSPFDKTIVAGNPVIHKLLKERISKFNL